MLKVDLNADLGEECGDDAAMMMLITSANVACGAHAGGGSVLSGAVGLAAQRGVQLGAHPSYRDITNFGRESQFDSLNHKDFLNDLAVQITSIGREASRVAWAVSYVKPHGALYHDAAKRTDVAELLLDAVEWANEVLINRHGEQAVAHLSVLGLPNSVLEQQSHSRGISFFREGFADRAYLPDGHLAPRSLPGAVLSEEASVEQALRIALSEEVVCIDGSVISMKADSICLHGDTPGAVNMAQRVRAELSLAGVTVAPFSKGEN